MQKKIKENKGGRRDWVTEYKSRDCEGRKCMLRRG
jgi:hypothetical protein